MRDMDYDAALDAYQAHLDEVCEPVRIGTLEYMPGRVLREVDPVAFRTGMNDWADAEGVNLT